MGPVVWLKKDRFGIAPGQKVIKAGEYAELVRAREILEKAEAEARRIAREAGEAAAAEKKRGFEQGLMEGRMGLSEQMMDAVGKAVDYFASVEEDMVNVVMAAVRKVLGEMDDREVIVRVVKNALAVARNQKQVTLRVSPAEADSVRERVNEILSGFPAVSFIDVTADNRLSAGGCILESDMGVVDASIEVQLAAIRKSLLKSFKRA